MGRSRDRNQIDERNIRKHRQITEGEGEGERRASG